MDAEQRRAEDGADMIDSIALEAIGSETVPSTGLASNSFNDAAQAAAESVVLEDNPIDEYCECHRLDVLARLELFVKVCQSVSSAHRHAVIHGSLNPDNILVTSAGMPKLVNFGDAKPVHGLSSDDVEKEGSVSLTRTGEPVLPLEYASPEQLTGETVTTSSDIYALGVILYELMTGRRPYHLKTGSISELLQAVCEQVPAKLSTAVVGNSAERLKHTLKGDLDAIILMAMRKEPESRYSSADRFADDLRFYLKRLPVRALRDSIAYRTAMFVHRRPAVAIALGIVTLALLAGVVGAAAGLIAAHRERDRAQASFREARAAANQFFVRVSEERLLNQPGLYPLRKTLLEDAQRFYETFLRRNSDDRSLQAEVASARTNIAEISVMTGETTKAVEQFEHAIALWDQLVATQPANSVYREALARALAEQGRLLMSVKDRHDKALHIFQRRRISSNRSWPILFPQRQNGNSP